VFVGSMAGLIPRAGPLLAYGSAKAALHHFVRGAAQELAAAHVRVNAVAPGLTRTPRLVAANPSAFWAEQARHIPLGKAAEVEDIASAILYLSTPMARHMTGQVLLVDGGTSGASGAALAVAKAI
jgi:NAD(P)-dependent dehydrogenase (short-subunit alcohol dehydrogenase family)